MKGGAWAATVVEGGAKETGGNIIGGDTYFDQLKCTFRLHN